jgi:two-component system chemotaxis response regulator CheB
MTPALIVIGTSLGGLQALTTILGGLPAAFPVPLAIVQHRSKEAPSSLRGWLQEACSLPIHEVEDKQPIRSGCVYLAPADYHTLVEQQAFALSTEAPVWYARPAIDVLFTSAADVYGARLVGVVLTGASQDGAQGLAAIKRRGGLALVQEPATAESRVMPEAAAAATPIDALLPLEAIAPFLIQHCSARQGS